MPQDTRRPTRRKQMTFLAILASAACLVGVLTVYKLSVANTYRIFAVEAVPIVMDNDGSTQSRGEHLINHVLACKSCHGANLSGRVLQDDRLAIITAPNLTTPRTDNQWLRALRYGIDDEGRALWRMPTRAHSALTDTDLAAVVAAVRAAPTVHHPLPQSQLRWRGNIAAALRQLRLVDASANRLQPAFAAQTPQAQGAYLYALANCAACHGSLNAVVHTRSRAPKSPLQRGAGGDAASFAERLMSRHQNLAYDTGDNGDTGSSILPVDRFAGLTNLELAALWRYLQSG